MMRELEGVCCSAFGQKKSRMPRMPPLSARAACETGGNESPGSRLKGILQFPKRTRRRLSWDSDRSESADFFSSFFS